MNELLKFTGAMIYLAFSIILLPVFFLFDVVMGFWLALRFLTRFRHRLQVKTFAHRHQWQVKKALEAFRLKHI